MSVRQEVIPGLNTLLANFLIIPPKKPIFFISRGKTKEEKKGEIKK